MLPSVQEPLALPKRLRGKPQMAPLRVIVEWSVTSFECGINRLGNGAGATGDGPAATGPVRLRVTEAEADSCRVEMFCAEACLCGASAGSAVRHGSALRSSWVRVRGL
jgi:hypothetical protein